jgi:ABC-2 type transport system ATP-binding protein
VFISSHLLDEVEKTCDVAAIIDGGRVIAQGRIEELVADEAGELVLECDDPGRALTLLAGDPSVRDLRTEHGALRMRLVARDHAAKSTGAWSMRAWW